MKRAGAAGPVAAALLAAVVATPGLADDWRLNGRFKAFGVHAVLPDDDLQRLEDGGRTNDGDLDLRLMLRADAGRWSYSVDHTTIYVAGDSFAFNRAPQSTLEQTPRDDDLRFVDLTWTLDEGSRHRLYHRFDRLSAHYQGADWRLTVGREPISWGSGRVFQPLDVFSPFAPTTTDRDYRPGEDAVIVDRLFDGGSDLQLVAVLRRDADENREVDEGTYAFKWRGLIEESEVQLLGGSHYQDTIVGASLRQPIGGALLQTDWLATRVDDDNDWVLSGVVNLDYSFTVGQRALYAFIEYYRNGFGRNDATVDLFDLPEPLAVRLLRGEVFNFMKDYAAVGGFFEWHPLLVQNFAFLANLHDGSSLLQLTLTFEPSDHQRLQGGWTKPMGNRGEEFGGVEVIDGLTRGGASSLYLRWSYFF